VTCFWCHASPSRCYNRVCLCTPFAASDKSGLSRCCEAFPGVSDVHLRKRALFYQVTSHLECAPFSTRAAVTPVHRYCGGDSWPMFLESGRVVSLIVVVRVSDAFAVGKQRQRGAIFSRSRGKTVENSQGSQRWMAVEMI
jgi:hypothetical protein